MDWETKKLCDLLYCSNLLCCRDLEMNPQYLKVCLYRDSPSKGTRMVCDLKNNNNNNNKNLENYN